MAATASPDSICKVKTTDSTSSSSIYVRSHFENSFCGVIWLSRKVVNDCASLSFASANNYVGFSLEKE